MAIKILLFIIGYLFIGWIVDRKMTDPENPEGFDVSVIIMFTWPIIVAWEILFRICLFITDVVLKVLDRFDEISIKKNKTRNKCKTCLYNKSASSRPVCLECINGSLYEPEEE